MGDKVSLPRYSKSLKFDKSALLIVDMQQYFVDSNHAFGKLMHVFNPDGSRSYFERVSEGVIPNIQRIQKSFRASGAYIGYTEFGSQCEDGADMPGWARRHNEIGQAMVGSPIYPAFHHQSCRVVDILAPQDNESVIQKSTSGPVNSTKLDQTLRVLGKDTVIVTGVVTEICVAQTAREFGDRNFDVIVVSDACCSMDGEAHRSALETIERSFGYVLSTEELLGLM